MIRPSLPDAVSYLSSRFISVPLLHVCCFSYIDLAGYLYMMFDSPNVYDASALDLQLRENSTNWPASKAPVAGRHVEIIQRTSKPVREGSF